ncbi:DUF6082 family protein [Streptomyces sp. NPDC090994]|uniref:DUF6082 family protein n=1 Tax=Streptomyces sp. NPDC090994 TaxID=3365969 RepID=UPI00382FD31C
MPRYAGWALAYGAVLAVLLAALGATPFLLNAAAPGDLNWSRLSDIAQVYGALSLIISALALIGVVISIIFQAQQARAAQEDASWNSHRELVLKTIDDPLLAVCWEPPRCAETAQEWRQIAYVNLIVTHWDKAHRLGRVNREQMRSVALRHFEGELARRHWGASGREWMRLARQSGSRRTREFPIVMDEAYQVACQAGPATSPAYYFSPSTVS